MVKITISSNDMLALFRNVKTKEIGLYLLKNAIKSKYGYGALQDKQTFYFVSISGDTLKKLIKMIEDDSQILVSAEFITGLYYVQKQMNKNGGTDELLFKTVNNDE